MPTPHVSPGDGTDVSSFQNPDGSIGARFDFWGRQRQGTADAPTVAVGAGAGTGASISAHTGTDADGNVTVSTGTSPAAGTLATVTFAVPFTGTNPPVVSIQAKDAIGAACQLYATCTNTVLTIKSAVAITASSSASIDYNITAGA